MPIVRDYQLPAPLVAQGVAVGDGAAIARGKPFAEWIPCVHWLAEIAKIQSH